MKTSYENDKEANRWNHRPNGPVTLNPLFDWPPRFFAVFRWYSAYWLAASTTTLACVLAVIAYFTILPSLELMQKPQLDWIIRVWLANLIPHVTCAGLLHLWLYKFKGQDEDFKFDPHTDNMLGPDPAGALEGKFQTINFLPQIFCFN